MSKNILLIGNYNAGNIGDDSLMAASKLGLRTYLPNANIKIMAPKAPTDLYLLPAGIKSFLKFKWVKALFALPKYDYLVFGGGGILNPEEFKSLIIWGLQIVYAKLFKVKIVLLANSFSTNDSWLFRYLIKKIDFITCRDKMSYLALKPLKLNIPIRTTNDLSFYLDLENSVEEFEFDTPDFIVLNLRSSTTVSYELQQEFFLKLVDELTTRTKFSLYLMPFCIDDVKFLRKFSNLVPNNGRVFVLPYESEVVLSALSQARYVISQRLHPTLFAVNLNKNFYALSYSNKVQGLLKMMGLNEHCVDFTINNEEIDLNQVTDHIMDEINNEKVKLNSDTLNLQQIKKEAEDNFRLFKTYIE